MDKPSKEKFNYPGIFDRSAVRASPAPQSQQEQPSEDIVEKKSVEKQKKPTTRKPLKLSKKIE